MIKSYLLLFNSFHSLFKIFNVLILENIVSKIHKALELYKTFVPYGFPNYIFHNNLLLSLSMSFSTADKLKYPIDAKLINWQEYIREVHLLGLNYYVLKPD